jgi:cytochrome c556
MKARALRGPVRRSPFVIAVVVAVGLLAAGVSRAQPEPIRSERELVALMHEDLSSLNGIEEALLRDDHEGVRQGASRIAANAGRMRDFDLASCGLDPKRAPEFERYVVAQEKAARAVASAAAKRDSAAVLRGTQQLVSAGCVGCHGAFLEADAGRTPRVLIMRTLLDAVRDMTRGVVMNDFATVARQAREIAASARIFTWSQVIEQMFSLPDPDAREAFRKYFEVLVSEAIRVESAAVARDPVAVGDASRQMLEQGCVACHARFRR